MTTDLPAFTGTLDDRIETMEYEIFEMMCLVDDAAEADNAELWDDLSTDLEDYEDHLRNLVAERDA